MAADGEQRATLIGRHSYRSPADRPPVERPIRLAVIGLGPRGRGNVVGKALTYAEYELAAVCDRRANLVAGVAETVERDHGRRVPGFTDYERMLREVEPDAVAVTTDVNVQIPIACAAMESGCHAMVEVPLCTSMEDCWRVVTTAERTGKVFLLMEQVRFSGYIRAWRRIVDAGVIGKPLFVEGEYFSCKGGDACFQDESGRDYYVFAQFADAVLHGVPVELDAYAAADTAAPAILAAVSIDSGNAPQDVPDFRPGPARAAGALPAGVRL